MWTDTVLVLRKKSSRPKADTSKEEGTFRKAAQWVDRGRPGRGCRLLCSRGLVDVRRNMDKIQALFPRPGDAVELPTSVSCEVEAQTVEKQVRRLVAGTAPGPSGLRVEHLQQLANCTRGNVLDELVNLLSRLIA